MIARVAVLAALVALLGACATQPLPGMSPLDSAKVLLTNGRFEEALDLTERVLDPPDDGPQPGPVEKSEATFVAAEANLGLGNDLKAFRLYKDILETWPWSPHTGLIEDRMFQIGLAFFYDERYGGWFGSRSRGVEVMETLQVHYSRSELADDALRHVGDYFASEDVEEWLEAALTYERLYLEYPESEWAERSLWLAGHCRLLMVPGPQYNRDGLLKAEELLELSLTVHPRGVVAHEAREDLARARMLLAEGNVLVANFYAGRRNDTGERLRLVNAALLYPDTTAGMAARRRLEELGLDLDALATDPRFNSIDKAESAGTEWEGHQR